MTDAAALVNELMAAISAGDQGAIRRLVHPELVSHGALGDVHGPEGFIEIMMSNVRRGFPDADLAAVDVIRQGDLISWRVDGSGTHSGPFLGLPPSDRRIRIRGIHQGRLRDGLLVEHWQGPDILTMLLDMGRLPFS